MVKYRPTLDATFAALSDPTRRAMLTRLSRGDALVSELAAPFRMSLPAVSKHLTVLEHAGLVRRERLGRVRRCHLLASPMKDADRWIARYRRYWDQQLNQLARYL